MIFSRFKQQTKKIEIFENFRLDFGSFWRPHRASNLYILLVVESLPIDQQLYQRIWSLHYWFGFSDGPKLRYLAKNSEKRDFSILGHF